MLSNAMPRGRCNAAQSVLRLCVFRPRILLSLIPVFSDMTIWGSSAHRRSSVG